MFIGADGNTAINLNYVRKLKIVPMLDGWCLEATMDNDEKHQIGEKQTYADAKDWLKEIIVAVGVYRC